MYTCIEYFKNGQYLNTKYNSEMRVFEIPHIIVFSNFSPDENMLSKDRYVIKNIESIEDTQNTRYPEVNIGNTKAMFTQETIKPEKPWHHSYVMKRCRDAIEQESIEKKRHLSYAEKCVLYDNLIYEAQCNDK